MNQSIGNWTIESKQTESQISLRISHSDMTPVSDTEADIGGGELAYRLTTSGIEDAYQKFGDLNQPPIYSDMKLDGFELELAVDSDDHLSIFCRLPENDGLSQNSITNGTISDRYCDLVLDIE